MQRFPNRQPLMGTKYRAAVLAIVLISGLSGLSFFDRYYRNQVSFENARELDEASSTLRRELADELQTRLRVVYYLRAFMLAGQQLPSHEQFEHYARQVLAHSPPIRALQFADEDLVIRWIYPLEGNEPALGLDLRSVPHLTHPYVERAIEQRRLTISDPDVITQGSLSAIARLPLFREDDFLGLVQVVFDVEYLARITERNLPVGTHFQLRTANGSIFHGQEAPEDTRFTDILAGDRVWQAGIWWYQEPEPDSFVLILIWGIGGALVLCIAFIVNRVMTMTEMLSRAVEDKTRAITEVNAELRKSEGRYRELFENTREGIICTDRNGRIVSTNSAAAAILGFRTAGEAVGCCLDDLHADPRRRKQLEQELFTQGYSEEYEALLRKQRPRDGLVHISGSAVVLRDSAGSFSGMEVFFSDITGRKIAEDALRESRQRLELALEGGDLILWDWDGSTGRLTLDSRFHLIFGTESDSIPLTREDFESRMHPEDQPEAHAIFNRHLRGESESYQAEFRLKSEQGGWVWMLSRGKVMERGPDGEALRACGTMMDITARRRAEHELEQAAFYDSLTGLPNRAFFNEILERTLTRANRNPKANFALLFLDIDRFKNINDSMGHLIGDELLIAVARRLQQAVREQDTVARLGGDEFVVLLDETFELPDVTHTAERIIQALTAPVSLGHLEFFPSASIGIVLSSTGYEHAEDVLRDADTAMYRAKENGRNRYEIFDTSMRQSVVGLIEMEAALRNALARGEFTLSYQPIVSVETGQLFSFEALLRWKHPERGDVSPQDFIPVAEDSTLIVPVGQWVMEEACRQTREWNREFPAMAPLRIGINISAKQFVRTKFREQLQQTLSSEGIEPSCVQLEITESVMLEEPERLYEEFLKLRELGVCLHLDDFGTGYSSLSYLRRFPVNCLKIDRTFVGSMHEVPENREIVRAIIAMANVLEIAVVAEGVENAAQLDLLRQFGCSFAQGYHLAMPMTAAEARDYLAEQCRAIPHVRGEGPTAGWRE